MLKDAIKTIKNAKALVAFTGAGISVESGIPPFRGAGGLWERYDPSAIDINFFYSNPKESWREMKKIFFNSMGQAEPNTAHKVLADWEKKGLLKGIITQNIDNLHQRAGSVNVKEFHGTINYLLCTACGKRYNLAEVDLNAELPSCKACGAFLKPDFIFYGEGINPKVYQESLDLAYTADVMLVIGTSGEVMPACALPLTAKQNGAKIIEINTLPSTYTDSISDFYFERKAGELFGEIAKLFQ